jgi:hypothetical protein
MILQRSSSKGKNQPFTRSEFIESLRDGREVYIYGDCYERGQGHPGARTSDHMGHPYSSLIDYLHVRRTPPYGSFTIANMNRA